MPYARSPIITMQDAAGNVLASGSVQVTNEATGGAAALYSDRNGTSLANPFTSETDGSFPFYAAGGRYRIDVTVGAETYTVRDVPIGLMQEQDTVALTGLRIAARAATTANITIATALNNGDTLDGVSLVTGNVVLVKNQTASAENGIYVVAASPARHSDFDAYDDHVGALVSVSEGTVNANTQYFSSANAGGILGTTAIDFTKIIATVGPAGAQGDPGPQGDPGNDGVIGADGTDPGVLYTWDDDTADSNQGAGAIWANNAILASATVIYLSKTSRGGSDVAVYLATLDDSTNTIKGQAILTRPSDGAQATFNVTGLTDATGYVKLAVAAPSGMTNPAAADPISFQFARAGDAGGGSGDVTAAATFAVDNTLVRSDGTSKGVQKTAIVVDDSNNMTVPATVTTALDDASTNTVLYPVVAGRSSAGTPANGIGAGVAFDVETSAANVERGMAIEAVVTDVTSTSEDFDLVAKLMAAGAAASEALRLTSAGVLTLLGNALHRVLTANGGMTLGGGFIAASYGGHGGAPPVVSSGTVTPAPGAAQANIQHYTNGGAHTLAPPASPCTVVIEITNNGSAGAITTSGFSVVDGDAFNTTDTKKFQASIVKTNTMSTLTVKALN